jgi:hypothetical protein
MFPEPSFTFNFQSTFFVLFLLKHLLHNISNVHLRRRVRPQTYSSTCLSNPGTHVRFIFSSSSPKHWTTGLSKDDRAHFVNEQSKNLSSLKTLATSEFEGFTKVERNENPEARIYTSNLDPNFADIPPRLKKTCWRGSCQNLTTDNFSGYEEIATCALEFSLRASHARAQALSDWTKAVSWGRSRWRLATSWVFLQEVPCLTWSEVSMVLRVTNFSLSERHMFPWIMHGEVVRAKNRRNTTVVERSRD